MASAILICLSVYILGANAGFASNITPCHWSDEKCIKTSAEQALGAVARGVPEIGMIPLDPLVMKDLKGKNGALDLTFEEMTVEGLSKCKFAYIRRNSRLNTEMQFNCPINAYGTYDVSGNLAGLDIYGHGPFKITTENMQMHVNVTMKDIEKDGKKHYKFTSFDYSYEPIVKVFLVFDNLYDGKVEEAKAVNDILSSNWKDMITVFGKPMMENIFGHCIKSVDNLFTHLEQSEIELPA